MRRVGKEDKRRGRPAGKARKPLKTLRGKPLRDFVARCKRSVEACGADRELRERAAEKLDLVAEQIGSWDVNGLDTPGLPNRPAFNPHPDRGQSSSNIPIPQETRHLFNDRKQRKQKWSGTGITAWCHYLAQVDEYVAFFANPPEAALVAAPANMKEVLNDLDTLEGRQDADIQVMAEVLFRSREADDLTSEERLATLRRDWRMFLGYLIRKERTQIRKINRNTLRGFRSELAGVLKAYGVFIRPYTE